MPAQGLPPIGPVPPVCLGGFQMAMQPQAGSLPEEQGLAPSRPSGHSLAEA